jgi:hypothetical protein
MKDLKARWQVSPEKERLPDGVEALEEAFVEQFTKKLHHEIELALMFQLSLIHGRVVSPDYLLKYDVKEVHPNGSWLYKYHGMLLVEVTPPSYKLADGLVNTRWKVECLPIDEHKATTIGHPECWGK